MSVKATKTPLSIDVSGRNKDLQALVSEAALLTPSTGVSIINPLSHIGGQWH